MKIHPSAIVGSQARLGANVCIGPFSIVEDGASVGEGCVIEAHVTIKAGATLGPNNRVFEGTVLGGLPQHVRIPERPGQVVIGANNVFRENCTVHRALKTEVATTIGDNNLIMVGGHVAHDCHLGNNIIIANGTMLGGHVIVENRAYISGSVGIHQFCRIGTLAMVGGHSRVVQDVPPYVTVDGDSGHVVGLNMVGLRRAGITTEQITELKAAYRIIYRQGLKWSEVLDQLRSQFSEGPAAAFPAFLSGGTRGFVQERRMPPGATLKLRRQSEDDERAGDQQFELKSKVG